MPDAFIKTGTKVISPDECQRARLNELSRLLRLVIENKSFGAKNRAGLNDVPNRVVRSWHERFKAYLQKIIDDPAYFDNGSSVKNLRRTVDAWIGRLPCSKGAEGGSKEIPLNVAVSTRLCNVL